MSLLNPNLNIKNQYNAATTFILRISKRWRIDRQILGESEGIFQGRKNGVKRYNNECPFQMFA